ncbi:MAG: AAA family ATPase [Acidimicrobiales bacterium]
MVNLDGQYQLARRAFSEGNWAECIRLAGVVLSDDPRHSGAMDLIASARRGLEISERGQGERRVLSILFCDLVGSVSLAAELGAERYRELLLDIQDLCVRAITAYEGRVAQYLGDGILAYFSYPQSHEGDAARATMAALEIADAVRTRSERYRQEYGRDVAIRIGIDTGTVVAGAMGSGQWTTSDSIVGDSINVASRVQGLAGPNSVLITDATYSLASAAVTAESPQTVELRNFPRPVTVWTAVGASAIHANARPTRPRRALVGRHDEVSLLNRAWSAALRGGSRQCLIVGDPGMGKTRLAEHAMNLCHAGGGRLVELRCSAVWAHSSLWPAAVALRRLLGLEQHDPDSFLQLLRERLRTVGGDEPSGNVVALLGRLLGAPVEIDLLPEQIRIMTMRALADLVAAVAAQGPVLLVVEDLHDADASTVELLQHLVARTDLPLMLLITSRRPHPELPFVEEVVTLEPLSDGASADLATALLPAGEQSEIQALVARADGVPLFIEELAYGLADGIGLDGLPLIGPAGRAPRRPRSALYPHRRDARRAGRGRSRW